MSKYEQTIAVNNQDPEITLALAYEAIKNQKWIIQYAGEATLLAVTPRKWNSNGHQIIIEVLPGNMKVTSQFTKGPAFDIWKRNKKVSESFISAFSTIKDHIPEDILQKNIDVINDVREVTQKIAQEETETAAKLNDLMSTRGGNLHATYFLIAVNVIVFILMIINGAGLFEPNGYVHIKWGSNYTPLTLGGDWWRLITSTFIHFGVIHVAMNMYGLFMAGSFLEPLLGKTRFLSGYLCTGIIASLVSLWWHKEGVNSAGASGAVFGLFGMFLALLSGKLIPAKVRQSLLQSIGIFVIYNLVFGLKSGVDNAAHIGGLVSGCIIGFLYLTGLQNPVQQKVKWMIPVIVVITLSISVIYLQTNKISAAGKADALNELREAGFKDNTRFNRKMKEFSEIEMKALEALRNDSTSGDKRKQSLAAAIPLWDNAESVVRESLNYEVSEKNHQKTSMLLKYVLLRKTETRLLIELEDEADPVKREQAVTRFNQTEEQLKNIVAELDSM